jgi:hypothetical protein
LHRSEEQITQAKTGLKPVSRQKGWAREGVSGPATSLAMAVAAVLVSIGLEATVPGNWFSRSGSLMVLMALVAEYQLMRGRDQYHSAQLVSLSRGEIAKLGDLHPNRRHMLLERGAHAFVILGTLIWGYGDLLI